MFYLQQENALLKAKHNDLHKLVGEILETVKLDAKFRVDKDREKNLLVSILIVMKTVQNSVLLDFVHRIQSAHTDT